MSATCLVPCKLAAGNARSCSPSLPHSDGMGWHSWITRRRYSFPWLAFQEHMLAVQRAGVASGRLPPLCWIRLGCPSSEMTKQWQVDNLAANHEEKAPQRACNHTLCWCVSIDHSSSIFLNLGTKRGLQMLIENPYYENACIPPFFFFCTKWTVLLVPLSHIP